MKRRVVTMADNKQSEDYDDISSIKISLLDSINDSYANDDETSGYSLSCPDKSIRAIDTDSIPESDLDNLTREDQLSTGWQTCSNCTDCDDGSCAECDNKSYESCDYHTETVTKRLRKRTHRSKSLDVVTGISIKSGEEDLLLKQPNLEGDFTYLDGAIKAKGTIPLFLGAIKFYPKHNSLCIGDNQEVAAGAMILGTGNNIYSDIEEATNTMVVASTNSTIVNSTNTAILASNNVKVAATNNVAIIAVDAKGSLPKLVTTKELLVTRNLQILDDIHVAGNVYVTGKVQESKTPNNTIYVEGIAGQGNVTVTLSGSSGIDYVDTVYLNPDYSNITIILDKTTVGKKITFKDITLEAARAKSNYNAHLRASNDIYMEQYDSQGKGQIIRLNGGTYVLNSVSGAVTLQYENRAVNSPGTWVIVSEFVGNKRPGPNTSSGLDLVTPTECRKIIY